MPPEVLEPGSKPEISKHGLFVILAATGLALLGTPLASPAMPEIARVFADNALNEPFARAILSIISVLPGDADVIFLVKFILLSIPALFIILAAPLVGWLSDNVGRKGLLNSSLLIFGISGASGYFADSFFFMFVGRAILGLSIAGIKTATVSMVGDYYEGPERNKVIGWQGSAMKIGGVVFMLLGGFLANFNWQVPFLGYMLAFVLLPSGLIALSESLPFVKASQTREAGEGLADVPFWPSVYVFVSAFLASGLFFITPVQLPFYLRNAFSASPFEMGAAIALGNTVGALISLVYYRFKRRMNFVAIYAFIYLAMAVGYFVVALAPSYTIALMGMVVAGLGFGLYVPNHSSWILSIVSPKRRGFGVGLVTTAMFLGQFSAPILVQPFIDPADPTAVWTTMSMILIILAAVYTGLSRLGGKAAASN
ncbi:MAG: MFS transporter [Gammaproteobacteria bacterium]|nr:MFS transporter [Gammaproteobacteria bacterium]